MITCPVCHRTSTPAAQIGAVLICSMCGASLVDDGDQVRRATGDDTLALTEAERQTLRKARGRTR